MTGQRWSRRGRARGSLAVTGGACVIVLAVGTGLTYAAFTDSAHADLGVVGGAYRIALVAPDGQLVDGDPEPLVLDDIVVGPDGSAVVEVPVVTTTPVTGPVSLTVLNARDEPLPPDPGMPGPGADPFDVMLYTVSVDGEVLVDSAPASAIEPVVITDWTTGEPRTVQIAMQLPGALGNPYYSGRSMFLRVQLDGRSS